MNAAKKVRQARQVRQQALRARHAPGLQNWVLLVVFSLAGLGFFPHLTIVILVGMMPSLVGYALARGLGRGQRAYTLAAFNLAGVLPYVFDMLWGVRQGASAALVLGDVYAWFVMYAAAALGAMVNWTAPAAAAFFIAQRNRDQARALRRVRQSLIDEWGAEVAGGDTKPTPVAAAVPAPVP